MKSFDPIQPELTLTEIAKNVGLNKSTVHRFMRTLVNGGFVAQDPETKRYRVGLALVPLGQLATKHLEIRKVAYPRITALQKAVGETVHLAMLDGNEVVYIDIVESTAHFLRLNSRIGKLAPAYCTGLGKAMLAFGDSERLEAVIANGLQRHTDTTITDPELLRADLAAARERGYAIDLGEFNPLVRCMAAPIFDRGGVVAAVSVTRIFVDSTTTLEPEVGLAVRATADEISRDLGDLAPSNRGSTERKGM